MGQDYLTYADYQRAADFLRPQLRRPPRVGLILGSGLNALADQAQDALAIPYAQIPHFASPSVPGHVGRLLFGTLEEQPIVLMQGRVHYYEGASIQQVALPVRVMRLLGVEILVVTNAAGGINQSFRVGDLMLITDHINLVGMTGLNPLRGPNLEEFGPRFPDMTRAYDRELRTLALRVAHEQHIVLQQGIYVGLAGPSFETPAELRFLQAIGADAVGMSTVPEVTAARHAGMRVLGISGISNVAILDPNTEDTTTHEEVLIAGREMGPRLMALVRGILRRLDRPPSS
jgi:purine-nucleoside phosphorylase